MLQPPQSSKAGVLGYIFAEGIWISDWGFLEPSWAIRAPIGRAWAILILSGVFGDTLFLKSHGSQGHWVSEVAGLGAMLIPGWGTQGLSWLQVRPSRQYGGVPVRGHARCNMLSRKAPTATYRKIQKVSELQYISQVLSFEHQSIVCKGKGLNKGGHS